MAKLWLLLLAILLISAQVVRAQDEGEEGGEGNKEASPEGAENEGAADAAAAAAAEAAVSEAAAKKPTKGPLAGEVDLSKNLPPLDVQPLSADSPILADDDTLFDTFKNAQPLGGLESLNRMTFHLKKAAALLKKMKLDLEGEKLWAKQVYEIIQNYEYKYAKTTKDIKKRDQKVKLLAQLVDEMKKATLQQSVTQQLQNAKKALGELVVRAGDKNKAGKTFGKIEKRIARLQRALQETRHSKPHTDANSQIHDILKTEMPAEAADALKNLVNNFVEVEVNMHQADEEEEQDLAEEEEQEEESEESELVELNEEAFDEEEELNEEEAEEEQEEEEVEEEEQEEEEEEEEQEEEEEEEADADAKAHW